MAARTRAIVGALLALALSSQLHAATALNILFIGNSITYYNSGVDVVCARFTGAAINQNRVCGRNEYAGGRRIRRTAPWHRERKFSCAPLTLVLRCSPVTESPQHYGTLHEMQRRTSDTHPHGPAHFRAQLTATDVPPAGSAGQPGPV